jgi:hypothetical protein
VARAGERWQHRAAETGRSRLGGGLLMLAAAMLMLGAAAYSVRAWRRPGPPPPPPDDAPRPPAGPPPPVRGLPAGAPAVWALPESVRVRPDATLERCGGTPSALAGRFPDYRNANPVWDAGTRRLRLAAARGETVGAHVIVEAAGAPVTVTLGAEVPGVRVSLAREVFIRTPRETLIEGRPPPGTCAPGDYPDALVPVGARPATLTRVGGVAPAPDNAGGGAVEVRGAYVGAGHRSYLVEVTGTDAVRVTAPGIEPLERRLAPEAEIGDGLHLAFHPPTRRLAAGPAFAVGDRFRFEAYASFAQPFYLEAAVPRDAAPGRHRGRVVVTAPGAPPVALTVDLEVADVTLPPTPPLLLVWRLYPDDIEIAHGLEDAEPQVRFANLREYLRMARAHGAEAIVRWVNPEGEPAVFDRTWGPVLSGAAFDDGQPPRVFELSGARPGPTAVEEAEFTTRLAAAAAHLERLGYRGQVLTYPIDEPGVCDYRDVARVAALVARGGAGRVGLLMTSHPFPVDPVDSQLGWRDRRRCGPDLAAQIRGRLAGAPLPIVWAANAQYYFPEAGNPGSRWAIDRVRAAGDRAWFYQQHEPWVGGQFIDAETLGPRVWGWIAWRYHADGAFLYAVTHWQMASHLHRNPFAISQTALTFQKGSTSMNGDGTLFYPGPPFGVSGPLASLRMKAFRRGVTDHTLLTLYAQRDPAAAERLAATLVPRALNTFVAGTTHAPPTWRHPPGRGAWSHDPVAYDEAVARMRAALAVHE